MAVLTLADAMRRALEARDGGRGAVIVTLVADRSGAGVQTGGRMVVQETGDTAGSLDPSLDSILVQQALKSLGERQSRSRSYLKDGNSWRDAGAQGGQIDVFFEVMARPPRLIIVGAGHIALPLAQIGKLLDFKVTVIDDRPEYANRERFPTADELLVGPYGETISGLKVDRDSYVVLVTRGHVHDLACLERVIGREPAYIGMIGSRMRVRTVLQHAQEHGHDPAALAGVRAPIGLDIGAQSPAEIAVAIAAEIVSVRRGRPAAALSQAQAAGV